MSGRRQQGRQGSGRRQQGGQGRSPQGRQQGRGRQQQGRRGGGGGQNKRIQKRSATDFQKSKTMTAHTVLIVPATTRKYRNALYFFNFLLTGMGLTMFALGGFMYYLDTEAGTKGTLLPPWVFKWMFVLGACIIFFGMLGGRGAVLAVNHIERGTYNWWLVIVVLFFTIVLLIELSGGFLIIMESNQGLSSEVGNEQSRNFIFAKVDAQIKKTAAEKTIAWWDWQKTLKCCGWKNNTIPAPLATGKYCTDDVATTYPTCNEKIWSATSGDRLMLVVFAIFFIGVQLVICLSSYCLAFKIQAYEPTYTNL